MDSLNEEPLQCAEIFRSLSGTYTFVCWYCGEVCKKFQDIQSHIESNHFNKTETATDFLDIEDQYNTNSLKDFKEEKCDLVKVYLDNDTTTTATTTYSIVQTIPAIDPIAPIKLEEDEMTVTPSEKSWQWNLKNAETGFKCDICGKCFKKKYILVNHLEGHANLRKYECEICKIRFNYAKYLTQHKKRHFKNSLLRKTILQFTDHPLENCHINDDGDYQCDICGTRLKFKYSMKVHMQKHANLRNYACEICSDRFNTRHSLRTHALTHDIKRIEQNKCNVCFKTFRNKQNLNRHSRVHTQEKPFKCELCEKSYAQSHSLVVHLRWHRGEADYQCNTCGLKFHSVSRLNMHMKGHNSTPCACDICNKVCANYDRLRIHKKLHTDERSYKCISCDRSFKSAKTLRQHSFLHTGEKRFKCKYCDMTFKQMAGRRGHEKNRHGAA